MQKHNIDIDLTVLKELVAKYWQSEQREKFFRSYEDKDGKNHNILRAEIAIFEPKYATKADGSKIESESSVLHNTGVIQVSENVNDEWQNHNFGRLQRWITKVDMTPPNKEDEDVINVDNIPF